MPKLEAAVNGARDIAMPVTFSVLTNMVTFMPLFFVPGFMGKIFKEIPAVVITVFFISLIESLFILPAHLSHKGKRREGRFLPKLHDWQQRFSAFFIRLVYTRYGPFLSFVLRWRYVSFSVGLMILLLAFGFIKSGRMGF